MQILYYAACLVGLFAVIGTFLPLLSYDDFWIRGFDFPRVQLLILLVVSLAVLTLTSDSTHSINVTRALQIMSLAALVLQVYRITPYLSIAPVEVVSVGEKDLDPSNQFDMMISNVLQDNDNCMTLIEYVGQRQPDVLLTLETNKDWEQALDEGLSNEFKYTIKVPLENRYGIHLYSKLPIRNQEVMHLIADSIPSIYTQVQLKSGSWVNLYCVHPTPPSPTEEATSTGRDAELAMVGKLVTKRGNANTIVAGDLNDVAWSHSTRLFKRLTGLLDPRKGRGLYSSFHADHWYARWPLDHVFHSTEFQVVDMGLGPNIGSDHFPIEFVLQFVPSESDRMREGTEEQGDIKEAHKTIKKAKEGKSDGLIVD